MIVGYARVSTEDQNLDLQLRALRAAGCKQVYTDHGLSGKGFDRPGLLDALASLKPGGVLVVWRLDRLGRSLIKLVHLVDRLGQRGIEFRSLTENIDTTSSGGRLLFHIMAALAEFERGLISERTRAGMEAARNRGQHLGRPPQMTPCQIVEANDLILSGKPLLEVARRFEVAPRTLRRSLLAT
ncbi:recombinase family protein [Agrobacterium rhizogenes]|nr:recombinase family protein [Rhizobium rhizogenes]